MCIRDSSSSCKRFSNSSSPSAFWLGGILSSTSNATRQTCASPPQNTAFNRAQLAGATLSFDLARETEQQCGVSEAPR
eukprot:13084090-Alexandrium_andersonii.AAC.1